MKFSSFVKPILIKKLIENDFLSGPYEPVKEEVTYTIKNLGTIPEELLNSSFFRIGPNPRFTPIGGYHWFDGDGMFHCLNIDENGKEAIYHNRFVNTLKLKEEEKAGHPIFVNIGDLQSDGGILKMIFSMFMKFIKNMSPFETTSNTSIIYHANKILTLGETGFPYELIKKDGLFSTKGVYKFGGLLTTPFTAHPKIDPFDDNMYGTSNFYSMGDPKVKIMRISKQGEICKDVEIHIRKPVVMHDFSITKNFIVLMDLPMVFDIMSIFSGKFPIKDDIHMKPRIGLLSKELDGYVKWFDIDEHFVAFHVVNSWEDIDDNGDTILNLITCDNVGKVSFGSEINDNRVIPHKITINTATKHVDRTKMDKGIKESESLDFPVIDPGKLGSYEKYAFFTGHENGKPVSIVKMDLDTGSIVNRVQFKDNQICGECAFVPSEKTEINGYIVLFVSNAHDSEYHIYSENLDLINIIKIPYRIPLGFHTRFMK